MFVLFSLELVATLIVVFWFHGKSCFKSFWVIDFDLWTTTMLPPPLELISALALVCIWRPKPSELAPDSLNAKLTDGAASSFSGTIPFMITLWYRVPARPCRNERRLYTMPWTVEFCAYKLKGRKDISWSRQQKVIPFLVCSHLWVVSGEGFRA